MLCFFFFASHLPSVTLQNATLRFSLSCALPRNKQGWCIFEISKRGWRNLIFTWKRKLRQHKTYHLFCKRPICGGPIPHCGDCAQWPIWGPVSLVQAPLWLNVCPSRHMMSIPGGVCLVIAHELPKGPLCQVVGCVQAVGLASNVSLHKGASPF